MLRPHHAILGFAILFAMPGDSWSRSQPKPQPQNKSSTFSAQQSQAQPAPPANLLTPEQIEKSISNGIDTAAEKYETRHPALPPDNSGWWFNFLLVAFTGGLVVVGASQCFLIFWTLKATETAANAALRQANILAAVEGPIPLIQGFKLVQYAQIPGETVIPPDPVPPGPIPPNCRILFVLENKGRTPLRLIDLCIEKFCGTALPAQPTYVHVDPWGGILEKGPIWIRPSDRLAHVTPADVGAAAATYPNGAFWVFGYFAYFNLLNERVEYKFLQRWDLSHGFVADNRPGYT